MACAKEESEENESVTISANIIQTDMLQKLCALARLKKEMR